jgi:iron complex outermembrane receptor protein
MYLSLRNETRFAIAANYHHTYSNNLAFLLSSRQEFLENHNSPFLPSVGLTYSPAKIGVFECSLSRSYRNPSWNDRYWDPGGNPDLKAEDVLMLNVSYLKSIKYKNLETEIKLATYYGKISDWIIWLPENGYWTPGNLALVEQKGLELETNLSLLTKVGVFKFTNLSSLQFSTNLSERVTGDDALGKQLIYVPLLQLNESFSWSKNSLGFTINYHYESRRFTADDHSSELAAYNIASLAIYKKMNLKYTMLDIGFRIDNLFSQEYQLVQGRPMPGRTLKLNFNYYL